MDWRMGMGPYAGPFWTILVLTLGLGIPGGIWLGREGEKERAQMNFIPGTSTQAICDEREGNLLYITSGGIYGHDKVDVVKNACPKKTQ